MESLDTLELEMAIIGEAVLENQFFVVADFLNKQSFNYPPHPKIWEACLQLSDNHQPIDLIMLNKHLTKDEVLHVIGCTTMVNSAANIAFHCMCLVELNIRRKLFLESEKFKPSIPSNSLNEFHDFQRNVCLINCRNDLLKLLSASEQFFTVYAPKFAVSIRSMIQLIDKKSQIINEKHGEKMILRTLKHYKCTEDDLIKEMKSEIEYLKRIINAN